MSKQDAGYRRAGRAVVRQPRMKVCWLGTFGVMEHGDPIPACAGRLVRCHLIPKQLLRTAGGKVWDDRAWVWGCGGLQGDGGHHGQLDKSRTLRLPRSAMPPAVEELAYELGLTWWLEREYGPKTKNGRVAHG
jgi:hypothetical protein